MRLLSLGEISLESILVGLLGASGLLGLVRRRGSRSRSLGHFDGRKIPIDTESRGGIYIRRREEEAVC